MNLLSGIEEFSKNGPFTMWINGLYSITNRYSQEIMDQFSLAVRDVMVANPYPHLFDQAIKKFYTKTQKSVLKIVTDNIRIHNFVQIEIDEEMMNDYEFFANCAKFADGHKLGISHLIYDEMVVKYRYVIYVIQRRVVEGIPHIKVYKYLQFIGGLIEFSAYTFANPEGESLAVISEITAESVITSTSAKKLGFTKEELIAWKGVKKIPKVIGDISYRINQYGDQFRENVSAECMDVVMDILRINSLLHYISYLNRPLKGGGPSREIPVKIFIEGDDNIVEKIMTHYHKPRKNASGATGEHRHREVVCYSVSEWETAGHWRHYKNGKKVFIKPHKNHRHKLDNGGKTELHITVK